jgi:thioester reductase-like protein
MRQRGWILLTGATGLLGRYLLRDLLIQGRPVAVLARDRRDGTAQERVEELVAWWNETQERTLPRPIVMTGDVADHRLGLSPADRAWLSRSCDAVLHAAAHVGFRATPEGEPWRTNIEGTRHVLDLCSAAGIDELHHVSTAFVCGRRVGTIHEDDLDRGQRFHNDYEWSKFEAERLLQQQERQVRITVYRPSIVVGDSRTGYTSSYHGIYRFLELADRLAQGLPGASRTLPLRLPFTGQEACNLVCVDWVAEAIARIAARPGFHGCTYHLTARQTVPAGLIREVAEDLLGLTGLSWAGPAGPAQPTTLEERFLDQVRDYWPYRDKDLLFDTAHTRAALPGLPAPVIDRDVLARLIRFALADRWGHAHNGSARVDCAHYVEEFFPQAVRRSSLAQVPLDLTVGLDVEGAGGGRWTCRWVRGELMGVRRGRHGPVEVAYRLDPATFAAVVHGRLAVQEAFFARRIEIEGDVEKALKLAVLFARLVHECPYPSPGVPEAEDVQALHV